jgi:hypothetical protein
MFVYKYLYNFQSLCQSVEIQVLDTFYTLLVHKSHHLMGPILCMPEYLSARIDVCVYVSE